MPEDNLIWHWEKDGNYSVRSAYHVLCDDNNKHQPETSNDCNQKLWQEISRAPIPNCVRNFLWRVARNILPTRGNLGKKCMKIDMLCPICNEKIESREHLFMQCPAFRSLWFASNLGIHVPNHLNLNSWLLQWLSCTETLAKQLFCITLWKGWKARNLVVFKNAKFNPLEVVVAAAEFVEEFNTANDFKPKAGNNNSTPIKWEAPQPGAIKLNVDAGCFNSGETCWGMIARNHYGTVSFATTKSELIKVSLAMAEVLGIRWCLLWVCEQQLENTVIESDAEAVVKCILGVSKLVEIDHIVLDCLDILSHCHNVSVTSVRRGKNVVAHELVHVARELGTRNWVGNVPHQVFKYVCNDSLSVI